MLSNEASLISASFVRITRGLFLTRGDKKLFRLPVTTIISLAKPQSGCCFYGSGFFAQTAINKTKRHNGMVLVLSSPDAEKRFLPPINHL